MLKVSRRRVSFLQREEADRLIEALPEYMKPIVRFALATGFCAGKILGVGQGETARRHRRSSLPRPEAHLGLEARAERHFAAGADGLGGWKSYEMVLREAHLAQKLSFVARRIERQPARALTVTSPIENVVADATFSLRSVH
jgi:hypothetical protein